MSGSSGISIPVLCTPPSRQSNASAGGRIASLDGLRGVAILAVLVVHYSQVTGLHPGLTGLIQKVCNLGAFGVDLFFVLSGYLITGILLETKAHPHYFRNFYVRRSLRIFPLYYGLLAVGILIVPRWWAAESMGLDLAVRNQAWLWLYGTNYALAWGIKLPWYFDHFWSLAIEEHFYLIWPLIVWGCQRRSLLIVCVALVLSQVVLRTSVVVVGGNTDSFLMTPLHVDGLLMGSLLAIIGIAPIQNKRITRLACGAIALVGCALLIPYVAMGGTGNSAVLVLKPAAAALLFAALLVVAIKSDPSSIVSRALRTRFLQFFGRYSYGLYVFHYVVFAVLVSLTLPWLTGKLSSSPLLLLAVFATINLMVSVPVAVASYHFYEVHWLRLKRYFGGIRPHDRGLQRSSSDEAGKR